MIQHDRIMIGSKINSLQKQTEKVQVQLLQSNILIKLKILHRTYSGKYFSF